ncbi:MAG: glycosyltransferase family 4 protein [Elusimicrobia bacterium]|nr:glycosyltransferase family 4 protein [Elusimicrobiota bacterium]
MKILNVCDSPVWDMVAYQALHTAARFAKLGHTAAVLCLRNSPLFAECARLKVEARPFSLGAKFGFYETGGWDIAHFYNMPGLSPLFLKKAAAGSRIFVTQIKLGSAANFEKLAQLQPYVDLYVGACNSVQEEFVIAGIDPQRTFMVPPCLNIGRWESAMLIRPAMFQKRPYKVGIISMDPALKEQELFLMMAKEVLDVLPETNFMIVGVKDPRIRELARGLGISHKVDILWERNDIPEVMAMMHIFAKTAGRPGLSLSLIEAQASGVPCVVPRLKGLSDFTVNERNGIIVEPGDPLAFARAVIRLISDPSVCHNMSNMAFGYVNNNMSVPVVANILLRSYEDVLQAKGSRIKD